jgi:hypothetical protein
MTQTKTTGLKQATMNILNGIGMGVIASLVPAAILGQLMKALLGVAPAFAPQVCPGFWRPLSACRERQALLALASAA